MKHVSLCLFYESWLAGRQRKWGWPRSKNEGLYILCHVCSVNQYPSLWSLFSCLPLSFWLFLPYKTFFIRPPPPSCATLGSHWEDSHVFWRPSEMKPHIGAVAGGRRSKRRLQKKPSRRSQARHQPATKLDVVKLSNYLRKLLQNLRRRKPEEEDERICFFTTVLHNKQRRYLENKNSSVFHGFIYCDRVCSSLSMLLCKILECIP